MKIKHIHHIISIILFVSAKSSYAQDVYFDLKVSPSVNMVFNTIEKYQNGLVQYNYNQLKLVSDVTWDLYVGANTSTQGEWDETSRYSESGETPPTSIVSLRVTNSSSTEFYSDFIPLMDKSMPIYIIGSTALDDEIACPNTNANEPGNYTTSSGCMMFNVDLMIKPGFGYRPGLYTLEIVYTLVENL